MTISRLEISLSKRDRVHTSSSSKGNQIKWFKDGYWFKANDRGYEDIAEWAVSGVLSCSTVPKNMFIPYGLCSITEDTGRVYNGSYSKNFLGQGDSLVTIDRLLTRNGVDIDSLLKESSVDYKVVTVLSVVLRATGLNMTDYFRTLFTLDAFILNEDRHFNNIAVVYNPQTGYRLCPIFDNGLSLLSDIKDYDYYYSLAMNISSVHAKPFSKNFDKQFSYFGVGLQLNKGVLSSFISSNKEVLGRVTDVLKYQMNRYPSLCTG
jgi:hypothetical protein